MVNTLCVHHQGHEFSPGLGKFYILHGVAKKKKKKVDSTSFTQCTFFEFQSKY